MPNKRKRGQVILGCFVTAAVKTAFRREAARRQMSMSNLLREVITDYCARIRTDS